MADQRGDGWKSNTQAYGVGQLQNILNACNIAVASQSDGQFMAYCPFHPNSNSPALSVSAAKGVFFCFNPSCGASGTVEHLVEKSMGANLFRARRIILKAQVAGEAPPPPEENFKFSPISPQEVSRLQALLEQSEQAQRYLVSRKITKNTSLYFQLGYDPGHQALMVPMHTPDGEPLGFIGRSIVGRRFANSKRLPKSKTLWNIHRAKAAGDTVIVVESSIDAMRVHQAGYPNVVATLGGYVSAHHQQQLNRYFSHIIIMTDFDRAGRKLGHSIAEKLANKRVSWAAGTDRVYPEGCKDAGEMTDIQIRRCLSRPVSNLEYLQWSPEDGLA